MIGSSSWMDQVNKWMNGSCGWRGWMDQLTGSFKNGIIDQVNEWMNGSSGWMDQGIKWMNRLIVWMEQVN